MKRKEGFEGQQLLVLPPPIVKGLRENPITKNLYLTHIGFYPRARYHFVDRPKGAKEIILIYCVAGRGWFRHEGKKYDVPSGHYFLLPAEGSHQYGSEGEKSWTIYFLHMDGALAHTFFERLQANFKKGTGTVPFNPKRNALFDEMIASLETGYSFGNLEKVNLNLWQLLGTFLHPDTVKSGQDTTSVVEKAIQLFKSEVSKKMTLQEVAEEVQLSVSHFSNLFKQTTGHAPMDYFLHLKIQKACQYLDFTHMQVKEISYEVGIEDQFYFSRLFKKIMGESPKAYRKRQR